MKELIINYQLSIINYQLSIINYQLSIINYQLSIINYSHNQINPIMLYGYGKSIYPKNSTKTTHYNGTGMGVF